MSIKAYRCVRCEALFMPDDNITWCPYCGCGAMCLFDLDLNDDIVPLDYKRICIDTDKLTKTMFSDIYKLIDEGRQIDYKFIKVLADHSRDMKTILKGG